MDNIASLDFFQIPRWGALTASRRNSCVEMLYRPKIVSHGDTLSISATLDYGHCLEPNWFDLYRVRYLRARFYATYQCDGEDFSDLADIPLGALARRWREKARCSQSTHINAAWAYEVKSDAVGDHLELEADEHQIRRQTVWRMAMMNSAGEPCNGEWHEGDFKWIDCQFGFRKETTAAWQNHTPINLNEAYSFIGTHRQTHSIGTGYYIKGWLDAVFGQWEGKVQFSADDSATRLTPDTPEYEFTFGRQGFRGKVRASY